MPSSPKEPFCCGRIHPDGLLFSFAPSLILVIRWRKGILLVCYSVVVVSCVVSEVFFRSGLDARSCC